MIRTIAIASSLLLLAGCGPTVAIDTFCANYTPVRFSASKDSPETIAQIRPNNAAWDRLCKR